MNDVTLRVIASVVLLAVSAAVIRFSMRAVAHVTDPHRPAASDAPADIAPIMLPPAPVPPSLPTD